MQQTMGGGIYPVTIPSGMVAQVDGDQIRELTSSAVARKVTADEYARVLNGWLGSFAMLNKYAQFVELYFWTFDLGDLGVLKTSHTTALTNKVFEAFTQYFKGNLNAFDTKMVDFITQVEELASRGQIEAPFSDALIGAAELVRLEDGT